MGENYSLFVPVALAMHVVKNDSRSSVAKAAGRNIMGFFSSIGFLHDRHQYFSISDTKLNEILNPLQLRVHHVVEYHAFPQQHETGVNHDHGLSNCTQTDS
jgi:hypothetical protein